MLQKNLFPLVALIALVPVAHAVPEFGGGGGGAAPAGQMAPAVRPNPETADKAYRVGFEEYQMATGLEKAGERMTGEDKIRNQEAVKRALTLSRDRFRVATAAGPDMRQAWNMLGYTSRKLGNYEESLAAYEKALELSPDYPEAIEYRAELFLLTGKLAQVKESYASLQKSSPEYAEILKTSMKDWVAAKKTVPGLSEADRAEFAAWVGKL